MNLFTTSDNPEACIRVLDDVLLTKALLESAQMISCAIRLNEYIDEPIPEESLYKVFNASEEHNVWVRENRSNYRWAFYYLIAALNEYQYRYKKIHDATKVAHVAMKFEKYFPEGKMTPFPRKFNKEYENYRDLMNIKDTFKAYKEYLITKWQKKFTEGKKVTWTGREEPDFVRR
jgi:hypothetical protein